MAGNIMVLVKIGILLMVIAIGSFYVETANWSPFAPNGIGGVLKGVSGVFFAYIGFDAISTTAEECRNPRRDLPRSMIYALVISTVLYVAISLMLTGMIPFGQLGVSDPLAFAFETLHLTKLSGIIALGVVIAMAGVLLVFQVGQPRIRMSMSRDGLLPTRFSKLHKIPHTRICHHCHRFPGCHTSSVFEPYRCNRSNKHRNFICFYTGFGWCADIAPARESK